MIINSIIAGAGGGSDLYHTSGTVSFHTGSDTTDLVIPSVDTSYQNYFISTYLVNSWKLVDGVWVENSNRDFTGCSKTVMNFKRLSCYGLSFVPNSFPLINKAGTSKTASINRTYGVSVQYNVDSNITTANRVNGASLSTVNQTITVVGADYVCTTTHGSTHHYDVWGWNNPS